MGKISCFYCNRKCKGDVLKVGEKYFHKECFTCKVCHKRMENTGFLCKDDSFYCMEDYKRYCASLCFSCNEKIIGEVVTALDHTFHKSCFKCSICQKCFSPGDRVSMRMSDFLCNQCCGQALIGKDMLNTKLYEKQSEGDRRQFGNGTDHLSVSETVLRDSQSSTVPIRRKHMANPITSHDGPVSNHLIPPTNSPVNERNKETELDISNRSSLIVAPKHFHLPPGNSRSWMYGSSTVGSKSHPLALSANNIYRSLSNSSQNVDYGDTVGQNNVKKMSSYASGDINIDNIGLPIEREDWPAPPSNAVIMSEKNRRKIINPTVEALSTEEAPRLRKPRSASQYTERDGISSPSQINNRLRLSEVINKSATDISSVTRINDQERNGSEVPRDPVSASRTPSAVCEPLAPPRYDNHNETSPSRNDEYFRSSNRHLGYSMEHINSTNRSFLSVNSIPGHGRNLRNSNSELQSDNDSNYSGLKKIRVHSNIDDYKGQSKIGSYGTDPFIKGCQSLNRTTIPYEQLRVSTLKMVRHINKSNLEVYLSEEEFIKLFQLTKPAFYQLPEWKRNDLKKRVDLF